MDANTETLSNIALLIVTLIGMYASAFWLAMIIWTFRDHHARSRDGLASLAAALTVAVLNIPGLFIYLLLRPKETLSETYERSLEEEALLQEIEEKPICPGCGRPTHHDWQACAYCHTKLKKACIKCGKMLELSWKLCPYCATSQVGYAAADQDLGTSLPSRQATRSGDYSSETYNANAYPTSQAQKDPYEDTYTPGAETLEFIDGDQY